LKKRIFDDGFTAENIESLQIRTKSIIRTFDKNYFENLMKDVPKKVRYAANYGVLSVLD